MDPAFWQARWREGRIGFHEGRPNDLLVAHAQVLGPPGRVLVPLCGKSEDLAFLASLGHEVVGVELAGEAVEAFFEEHGLAPSRAPRGALEAWTAGGVTILLGDFFDVRREDVGAITAFYDRAAIVALPPEMRPRYAAHLLHLAGNAPGLLIAFEYPQERMEGPPFSVEEAELRRLFPAISCLEERIVEGPRSRASGVVMRERAWRVAAA